MSAAAGPGSALRHAGAGRPERVMSGSGERGEGRLWARRRGAPLHGGAGGEADRRPIGQPAILVQVAGLHLPAALAGAPDAAWSRRRIRSRKVDRVPSWLTSPGDDGWGVSHALLRLALAPGGWSGPAARFARRRRTGWSWPGSVRTAVLALVFAGRFRPCAKSGAARSDRRTAIRRIASFDR